MPAKGVKLPPRLTPRQEAFALAVAEGKTQADAYRLAYPKSQNWAHTSLYSKASEMMRNGYVAARVEEHKAALRAHSVWTREQSVAVLVGIASGLSKDTDKIAATKELNAMHGFNEPTQVNLSGAVSVVTRRIIDPAQAPVSDA